MHLDVEAGIVGGVKQLKHEPCHIFRREPGGTKAHGDLTGGEIHRLHGFQGFGNLMACIVHADRMRLHDGGVGIHVDD